MHIQVEKMVCMYSKSEMEAAQAEAAEEQMLGTKSHPGLCLSVCVLCKGCKGTGFQWQMDHGPGQQPVHNVCA